MPGFDGSGPRRFGQGKRFNPCESRQRFKRNRFWNFFNFFPTRFDNQSFISKEDQMSFLVEKLQAVEEETRILTEKIDELKRS